MRNLSPVILLRKVPVYSVFFKDTNKNVMSPITYETKTESTSLVCLCIIRLARYVVFCWLLGNHFKCEHVKNGLKAWTTHHFSL